MILVNSASYSGWAYRWQCLETLYADDWEAMRGEHDFLQRIAAINVKNYQLWNHRRQLAFRLGPETAHQVRIWGWAEGWGCSNTNSVLIRFQEGEKGLRIDLPAWVSP